MKKFTVAVSGINSVDNPGSGIGIIRSLKEANSDCRCIGLSYDAMDPGLYLDQYIDKGYLLPYPSVSNEQYFERLLGICEENFVDVIIPAFDSELPHYIKNEDWLQSKNIGVILPKKKNFESTHKVNLSVLAEKIGVLVPKTIAVTSLEDLNQALETVGFPAMIKGCFYEAFCAHSYFEAQSYFHQLSQKWGFPILVQQYLQGNDYNLAGLASKEGKNLGMVAIKKLLMTHLGKIWTAVTIENPKMMAIGKKFIELSGFTGGFELEFRMTDQEKLYLLEINPRFPAWIYLATAAGVNLPYRYVSNLLENKSEFDSGYEVGKLLVRYTGEMIRDISDFKQIVVQGECS